MFTEKMEKAFNEQIKWELYSAYLYLSMAAYFDSLNLPGFSKWMKAQAVEETMHAMKFYNFINERGGKVDLEAIDKPPTEWESPLAVMEYALNHEKEVTRRINNLMELAQQEKDHASQIFLQWFITEQVEEEDSFGSIVAQMRLVKDSPEALFMIDRELASRNIDFTGLTQEVQ
ncbi:Ferroxidase [Thermodesulfatator indicus DSM 15286]|uniref:Ferritin n=1 Tax=Thermodesulfatator indicus (strain DSM 15286 / JCM 11887 / CIR29812) TaxID=667014 RepID=F8ADJ1_THEID|nr:ferritin [Thermodesulfatator indicus]AEH44865.1 Ferroxidase [Thermodesulfatator indicus DSM 15286]